MRTFDLLLALSWILNVYDMVLTLVAVSCLDAKELNPLMLAALRTGPVFFIASKLTVHAIVCWTLDQRLERHPKKTWATLIIICFLFAAVAVWNTAALLTV